MYVSTYIHNVIIRIHTYIYIQLVYYQKAILLKCIHMHVSAINLLYNTDRCRSPENFFDTGEVEVKQRPLILFLLWRDSTIIGDHYCCSNDQLSRNICSVVIFYHAWLILGQYRKISQCTAKKLTNKFR